jgi:hypothetical protein
MRADRVSLKEVAMVATEQDQQDLAQAILAGTRRRPAQSFGSYFGDDDRSSCALGAAYDGMYLLPHADHTTRPRRLDWLFECLDNVTRRCPEGCKKTIPLGAMIVHLNDDHQWTREQIAEWVRSGK